MSDKTAIDAWLEGYRKAWSTDSPEDIARLFEPDARYFTAPFREPHAGVERIVEWWVDHGDSKVAWTFEGEAIAREGGLHVVRGVTTYPGGFKEGDETRTYDNIWLITLADSGRATEFVEYWMVRK
jgi:hypothetical protein